MPISHRAAKAAAVATLAMGATVAVAPMPAHAYVFSQTRINIHPVPGAVTSGGYPDQQVIDINGVVEMSQAAASDAINRGQTIALRYWGDDPDSDDLLYGPVNPRTVFAAADGLHFQHYVTLPHFLLDEDSGTIANLQDNGLDEVYVGSRLLDRSGTTIALAESNHIVADL